MATDWPEIGYTLAVVWHPFGRPKQLTDLWPIHKRLASCEFFRLAIGIELAEISLPIGQWWGWCLAKVWPTIGQGLARLWPGFWLTVGTK